MNRMLNALRRLLLWLSEVDATAEPLMTPAEWADLPPYHEPAPRS